MAGPEPDATGDPGPPISHLLKNNREWAESVRKQDPEFFHKLSKQQTPAYLWIGCSDSRVPANQIVGMMPGEIFVHRNVANLVVHTDLNCLSVLQFAVDLLKVRHVIVCGHYGCAGIRTVLAHKRVGLADNWLRHLRDIREKHDPFLASHANADDRLCELNVIEQVVNVCRTATVQDAWERGQDLAVHGWIYGVNDGFIRDLHMTVAGPEGVQTAYRAAVSKLS